MNKPDKHSDEPNANKRVCLLYSTKRAYLQWCIMSTDPPGIKFFHEKYLLAMDKYIMVIPTHLHCMLGKHLMTN